VKFKGLDPIGAEYGSTAGMAAKSERSRTGRKRGEGEGGTQEAQQL
jgi:hypothetical protein